MKLVHLLPVAALAGIAAVGAKQCSCHCSTAKITDAVMASKIDPDEVKAEVKTNTFATEAETIYCVVTYRSAPKGTKLEVVWRYEGGGPSSAPPPTEIDSTDKKVDGSGRIAFSLSRPKKKWPPGDYEVEILLDGKPNRKLDFKVE